MRIKDGYLLRQVAGQHMVVPVGDGLDLDRMITLNGTGAFLWERMTEETDEERLVAALLEAYTVDEATARQCVRDYVQKLRDHDFLC